MHPKTVISPSLKLSPLAFAVAMVLSGQTGQAQAVTCDAANVGNYTVNSAADTNDGDIDNDTTTLREALADLNVSSCNDYLVEFDSTLDMQSLSVATSLAAVDGETVTVRAPAGTSVTLVPAIHDVVLFAATEAGSLTVQNLIIDSATTVAGIGNPIPVLRADFNATLTILDSTVNNRNGYDSVVKSVNTNSTINIINSSFDNNRSNDGGAVYTAGNLSIVDSVFTNNQAAVNESSGNGGAVFYNGVDSTVEIRNSRFDMNSSSSVGATTGRGGAVSAKGAGACVITIVDSTFSNNTSTGDGGAISIDTPTSCISTFTQITVSGNTAGQKGGGIVLDDITLGGDTTLTIRHSTVTDNDAVDGGGLAAGTGEANINNVVCQHSIVADNRATNIGDNLQGLTSFPSQFCFQIDGAMLEALADNGGDTLTHYPMNGSPVIDAGNSLVSGQPTLDQRGAHRIRSGGGASVIDIGAVEFGSKLAPVAASITDIALTVGDVISEDLSVHFSDPEGDVLSFTQSGLPANFNLSSTGLLSGTVTDENFDNGPRYIVTITASDGSFDTDAPLIINISDNSSGGSGSGSFGAGMLGLLGILFGLRKSRREQ